MLTDSVASTSMVFSAIISQSWADICFMSMTENLKVAIQTWVI